MHITSDVEAVAQHLPNYGQAEEDSKMNFHPVQNPFHMMSYGMEYPFGQFKPAVLILFPPSSLGPSLRMALSLYNTA